MHAALERPDIRQYLTACHELFKFLLALQGASTYVPLTMKAKFLRFWPRNGGIVKLRLNSLNVP